MPPQRLRADGMLNRTVQATAQFIFYTAMASCIFILPAVIEALIWKD